MFVTDQAPTRCVSSGYYFANLRLDLYLISPQTRIEPSTEVACPSSMLIFANPVTVISPKELVLETPVYKNIINCCN